MPGSGGATTAPHRVLASSSRVEILHLLQQTGAPLGVDDLARLTGRHVNTTREHLERLRLAGYVERSTEHRRTRGRPRVLYTAVDRVGGASLDERLREHIVRTALEGYGEDEQPLRQVAVLEAHLEEMRMSPDVDVSGRQVHLRSCPFLDLARQHTDVVCSVHLAVLRGVLEEEGGPVTAERLVPFVGPQHCRIDLAVDGTGEARRSSG